MRTNFLQPGQNCSKMYGTEPRINEILVIIIIQSTSGNIKFTSIQWIPYLFDYLPWALIKFLYLESGRLLNFHHFQQVKYVDFARKQ